MSRYSRGMKDGAEPFNVFFNEKAENMRQNNQNINEKIDSINESIYDIIDLIEMDDSQRADFINELKSRNKKKIKPAKFNIKIISSHKSDSEFAENLRKSFHNQGNTCYINNINEFKNKPTGIADYNIFIRDVDKLIDESSTKIFSAYGSEIYVNNNRDIIATYNSKIEDKERDAFISYYSNLAQKVESTSNQAKKASNALKKRPKTKFFVEDEMCLKISDFATDVQDKSLETADKLLEFTGFLGLIPAFLLAIIGTISSIGILLLDIPFGISEVIVKSTINELKNSNFDKSFVGEAQRQILQIKLCEYISTEQLRLSK